MENGGMLQFQIRALRLQMKPLQLLEEAWVLLEDRKVPQAVAAIRCAQLQSAGLRAMVVVLEWGFCAGEKLKVPELVYPLGMLASIMAFPDTSRTNSSRGYSGWPRNSCKISVITVSNCRLVIQPPLLGLVQR
jgi:hypothetical protein